MKIRQARKVALAALPWLRDAMSLNAWLVNIKWVELPQGIQACCRADARYRIASLDIDVKQHTTEGEILQTLRHELAHLLHIEFELFEMSVAHLIRKREREALSEVYEAAQEKTVVAIEAMLERGLGLTPEKMIAIAKRRAR